MKLELYRFFTEPRTCQYLAAESARLEYRIILAISPEEYEEMLERGWRRMGIHFFRPACAACAECRSLRVPVEGFKPSRSQRRVEKLNASLRLEVQAPTVTDEHLRLWNAFHAFMQQHRGWPEKPIDAEEYQESFLSGVFAFRREFLYYDDERLVGVGLVDQTEAALSSIYFYHDPEYRDRALGVYSLLAEMRHAREHGVKHVYLGYWVKDCPSMNYKAQYGPHELLEDGWPPDEAEAEWRGRT